jgi:type I restriction enzyme, S subunit
MLGGFCNTADIEKRYQKAKAHVDKLTQSILAKAFRGELVPQDPNDEPASGLLKRIREERQKQEAESRPGRRDSRRGGTRQYLRRKSKRTEIRAGRTV